MHDENTSIRKLTDRIGNSFNLDYGENNIRNVISTAIDSLVSDNKLHIGTITAYSTHICLAQKYYNNSYACGLVFAYSADKVLYQRKYDGTWKDIREI